MLSTPVPRATCNSTTTPTVNEFAQGPRPRTPPDIELPPTHTCAPRRSRPDQQAPDSMRLCNDWHLTVDMDADLGVIVLPAPPPHRWPFGLDFPAIT